MTLTHDQTEKVYRLAYAKFKKIFGRRIAKDGYFNPGRSTDEDLLSIFMFYYRHFRKRLWK